MICLEKSGKNIRRVTRAFDLYSTSERERLVEILELVSEHMKRAQECQMLWYDQNARHRVLESGEDVLVLLPTTKNKLLTQWQGPYM